MFPYISDSPLQLLLHSIFLQNSIIRIRTIMTTKSTAIITSQSNDDPSSVKTKPQNTHSKLIELIEEKKQNEPRGCLINDSGSSDIVKGTAKTNESSNCLKGRINPCIFKPKNYLPTENVKKRCAHGKENCHSHT